MREIVAFVDEGLGNSSYLVHLGDGGALVVDPSRDPAPYEHEAQRRRLSIGYAAETHLHADFVSGSRELAAHGAAVIGATGDRRAFPHIGVGDGDEIDLGGLRLRALATPGHTPHHVAYLLLDGERPAALFTGGSMLVGSVARTDLISPDRTEELARAMYRTLHLQFADLPDDLAVYPTHGAGSFCSAPAGVERTTTMGRERAANPLLTAADEDAFVARLLDSLGTYPRYFDRLAQVNQQGPPVLGMLPQLAQLGVADVRRLAAEGAWVIDVRDSAEFAAGHIPGALSIHLRDAFGTWLGWLVPPDTPVVFVCGADQDRVDLVRQALKVGYEQLAGELEGGMAAWREAGLPEQTVARVSPAGIEGTLIDVRQASEYVAGHVPGAILAELGSLGGGERLPRRGLTVMCEHGERSMSAASLLQRAGRDRLTVVTGSADEWAAATGRPLQRGS